MAQAPTEHQKLFALFHDSDEATLKRQPLAALFRGDMRYPDRIGDLFTNSGDQAELQAGEADLKALHGIDRAKLDGDDRIAYDVFENQTQIGLKALRDPDLRTSFAVRPINHFGGAQLTFADLGSGEGPAPFNTVADYENNLKRNRLWAKAIDQIIVRFRQGMQLGIVETKLTTRNMIDQFDQELGKGVEGSTYYQPIAKLPAGFPAADKARLKGEYAALVRDDLRPAFTRLRDFLKNDYLPAAREGVGLKYMKGGDKVYAYDIEANTTLPLSAKEVHELGLSEVARILGEMRTAAAQAGFKGTLPELFTYMRTDKRFQRASVDQLRDGYLAIRKRVEARIPEQFSTLPKTGLEIRPTPDFKAKTAAGGEYEQGTADGKRPGVFYYNGYDLPSRYMWEMETLFLHEAEPGHHFQISLAQENTGLPAFMRYGGNTAYAEGWALYSESLWKDLGMETDPWQRLGGLNDEMLRAMRLVVDSGIHAYGWSRAQSIQYMLDNSPESVTDATAEVERYIAIPGQALAYKIGQLTIQRCKEKAMRALGAKFDPRAFHAQVLMTGSLPMPVLEKKIDDWIAAEKAKG
ncbi:uncharacterized protein (DUF885 family) [Sphingomonas vulcanisoli]|uniref:Uncharacterized protein (DUF885 family) n=1 Tax=Sphingomonas vulcanisoli TaxID=1658060 RepID=A0ABX0TTP5_9SPHN|nr:DUF885 domain-containing protein [Sphingomonas vulcanisoli]NIJ08826.1 uncharacterized protein (DUF885 family) [Sphingomonas vulcanisoli]